MSPHNGWEAKKKKKKNELTWENEVSREGSVYFMTTQSEVRSVEI